MDLKYASASLTPPPNDPPRRDQPEYVNTNELVYNLNKLLQWCEEEIFEARRILTEINLKMEKLEKDSEKYNKYEKLKEAIQRHLERTNDDQKMLLN